jgi:exopolysaccharide biosynthesis polyprenyl glycosylphosphotransferase
MSTTEIGKTFQADTATGLTPVLDRASLGNRTRFEMVANALERLFDLITVMLATQASYYLYAFLHIGRHVRYPWDSVTSFSMVCAIVFMLLLDNAGAYRRANSLMRIRETERILQTSVFIVALIFPITFFSARAFSRGILLIGAVLVPLALILEKQAFLSVIYQLHRRNRGIRRVLIYGAGYTGQRVFSVLGRSIKLGLRPVAIVDDNPELAGGTIYESGYKRKGSAEIVCGPLTSELIRKYKASMVIVAIPSLPQIKLNAVAFEADSAGAISAFVPRISDSLGTIGEYADIDGLLIAYRGEPSYSRGYDGLKRVVDFVAASLLLCLIAPIWCLIALLIRIDSLGPVLFKQSRVGRNGKVFQIYKFRTMHVDTPSYAFHPTDAADPRLTNFGRWLRRASLDELPQLLNVLKGEMSLVGPRPEMPFIVETYEKRHRQRLCVMPGITGLWQLSADRAFPIHDNLHYDLYYISHRNFFMDVAILLHTFLFAMRGM